jgi:excisionase family DNA binding protein
MKTKRWVSLQAAADMLGVHTSTLRRWAEEGVIAHTVTVGGHRRFDVQELERFLAQRSRSGVVDADESGTWVTAALTQARQGAAAQGDAQWLKTLDEASRERHRMLGRRLMGLTLQFISAEAADGRMMLDEAHSIGVAYAQLSRAAGVPLRDALEAALFFRDRLLEASWEQPLTMHGAADRRLDRRINELLNQVQLGMAQGYEVV